MNGQREITAELIEATFGTVGTGVRFANFCNAVILAECSGPIPSIPVLSEKAGADGSFDGEWTIDLSPETAFSNPFAEVGWNVFQFKARSVTGGGRGKAVSGLKSNLKAALNDLVERLKRPKEPSRYVLFTNLQLGLESESTTQRGATLSQDRSEIEAAIRCGPNRATPVHVVDAAQLAALVNKHVSLRLTYFSAPAAGSWDEKWNEERSTKSYKASTALIGRKAEMKQMADWLADINIKVIAIIGPSGMGKTRLALESTSAARLRTTVVDAVEDFERWGLSAFGDPSKPWNIIVEDPDPGQAERLTKQAVANSGVKLVFTFPSEADAPILKLTQHESVRRLVLQPLANEQAKELLSAAGAQLDGNALDWVLLQAGGNPEILLSAAELGKDLREKSGSLKVSVAELYRRRIEAELGTEAFAALRLISALQWVKVSGEKNDLQPLISSFGTTQTPLEIANQLRRLEQMGYIRRRGEYAMVVPPIFAAALVEDVFSTQPDAACSLFDRLGDPARKRLLERVVTTDLGEESPFWDHVFSETLGTLQRTVANLDFLDYLARANPGRTALLLLQQIEVLDEQLVRGENSWKRGTLIGTVRELAYYGETCRTGLLILQTLALREMSDEQPGSATKVFCECFIHWFISFPMSFQDRERCVRQMLKSDDAKAHRLAARVVVMVTAPPHMLSGYAVHARKLGPAPQTRFWRDVHDYLENFLDLRFELTQSSDSVVAGICRKDFERALQELKGHLPPDRIVSQIERLLAWHAEGKFAVDEREVRSLIHWLEDDYRERSEEPSQKQQAEEWKSVLDRLAALRQSFESGPFTIRLKIALGPEFESAWEEVEGKRLYGFEKRCRKLAAEVVHNPLLMTGDAWKILREPSSIQSHTLVLALGELDLKRSLLPDFESRVGDPFWDRAFGLYLTGAQRVSSTFVESRLEELSHNPTFSKGAHLAAIQFVGPTTGNRRRLLELIAKKSVESESVAAIFTTGRWLDDIPASEVKTILEFIAAGPAGWPKWILRVLNLYLHPDKALPAELFSVAKKALYHFSPDMDPDLEWKCNRVAIALARANLEEAFELFRNQIIAVTGTESRQRRQTWNPFERDGSHDFWTFLCANHPERTCREFLRLKDDLAKLEGVFLAVDLEKDREAVMRVASENESSAAFLAENISGAEKGFFAFSCELMNVFPMSESIRSTLASSAMYQTGDGAQWDNYDQALSRINTEIDASSTPKQHLDWLNRLKQQIQETLRLRQSGRSDDHHLGWN